MIPLVSHKYKYIFYYNPKSACSTFRKLYLKLHREELVNKGDLATHHKLKDLFVPLDGYDYSSFLTYSVVRNPYSRIVSSYLDKCCEIKYDSSKRFKNKHFNKTIHEKIFSYLGKPINFDEGYSFDEFLDYLTNNSNVDPHFKSQTSEFVNHYYRIEDDIEEFYKIVHLIFKDDLLKLDLIKNFFSKPNFQNRSNKTFGNEFTKSDVRSDSNEMSFSELKSLFDNKIEIDYGSFYKSTQKKIVSDIYKTDIENYKYEFPY